MAREDVGCDCGAAAEAVITLDAWLVVSSEMTVDEADGVSGSAVDNGGAIETAPEVEAVDEDGVCAAELVVGPVPIGTVC